MYVGEMKMQLCRADPFSSLSTIQRTPNKQRIVRVLYTSVECLVVNNALKQRVLTLKGMTSTERKQ
jgi:hypothetical protein